MFRYDFIWVILRLNQLVITFWEFPYARFHMHLCMRPSKCASQTNNLLGSNYHLRYQYIVVQTLCRLYTNNSEYEGETSISVRILLLFPIRTLQLTKGDWYKTNYFIIILHRRISVWIRGMTKWMEKEEKMLAVGCFRMRICG